MLDMSLGSRTLNLGLWVNTTGFPRIPKFSALKSPFSETYHDVELIIREFEYSGMGSLKEARVLDYGMKIESLKWRGVRW